jgi:hypothetical protein
MDICEVAWDALTLVLRNGESVSYTAMSIPDGTPLFIEAEAEEDTTVSIYQNEKLISTLEFRTGENARAKAGILSLSDETTVTLKITKGSVKLYAVCFGNIGESRYSGFLEIEIPQV